MTKWGWVDANGNSDTVWVAGTLEASYARVAIKPGRWILVSAYPVSEYRRVMAETARKTQ